MHLGINRSMAFSLTAIIITILVMGCSNNNDVTPTASFGGEYSDTMGSGRIGIDDSESPDSGAPAEGIVVEGVSVPGIALGYTRAQVEAAYGDPIWCQNVNGYDQGACAFPVQGGGQVDVRYFGADGGPANNSPDDVVHFITWYESVSGWVTTAGVTTMLAADNPDAIIAAYPDAYITYNSFGGLYSVIDYQQGIVILWVPDFYNGTTHVQMSIRYPGDPPPPPENLLRVTDIDLTAGKGRGQRRAQALVRVENELGQSMSGATVSAYWTYPDGSAQTVEDATSSSGYAYFEIVGIRRGFYELTIDNVALDGFTFDSENSILNASINVK